MSLIRFRLPLLVYSCCTRGARALQVEEDNIPSTVLMLGCSLDRNAISNFCISRDLEGDDLTRWCADTELNVRLGFIFHPGLGYNGNLLPPFHSAWIYGSSHSTEKILHNRAVPLTVKMLGTRDPDLVVVDTSLWDLAVWKELDQEDASEQRVRKWCDHDLPNFMTAVAALFPKSRIAFRTTPTLSKTIDLDDDAFAKFSSHGIEKLYKCITNSSIGGKFLGHYELIDFHEIMRKLIEKNTPHLFQDDGYHPGKLPSALYMNEVLRLLGTRPKDPDPRDFMSRQSALGGADWEWKESSPLI